MAQGFFSPGGFFSGSAPAGSGGGGSTWVSSGGIASVSTSGTGEDDLASVTLPQDSHNTNTAIRIKAAGTKTGTAGTKTIKFHFGTQEAVFHPALNDEVAWQFDAVILLTSATKHEAIWSGLHASLTHDIQDFTDDLSAGDITLKCTGECEDAGDDITQTIFMIELIA